MTNKNDIFDPKATTIQVLRYVIALAEHTHFGRAAAAARVSQPTLSAAIKQWEQSMQCQVFERDSHGVRLTPAGEQIVAAARHALLAVQAVEMAVHKTKPPFYGPVRFGVIPTVGPYALPFMVEALEKRLRDLDFPIREDTTNNLLDSLDNGHIDIAVLAQLNGMERRYHVEPLFREPFYVTVAKRHALSSAKKIELADIEHERLLLLDEGHCLRDQALELCDRRFSASSGADYRATSLETLRHIVASGAGITILPALACHDNDERLSYIPFASENAARSIVLLWRSNDPRAAAYTQITAAIRRDLPRDRIIPL
jgi:LysR family transcriptional regulator, hydrogen peroxide-inducible genes activator